MINSRLVIEPGATVGVLGSGQLGRMFAIAARRMGYRVHTYSPDNDTPTGQVADLEIQGAYEDLDRVQEFARGVSVVTFEFENVPSITAAAAEGFAPVRPSGGVLHTTQHRLREKTYLSQAGFPVTPFRRINSEAGLVEALSVLGVPAILKTAGWGYDGRGQIRINRMEDAADVWKKLDSREAVLEAFVDFECEISVVAARGLDGQFSHFGAVMNHHSNHILDVTLAPAPIADTIAWHAIDITEGVLKALDVVGVLCVEFFLTKDHELLINELAPRPHNSGHFSFDACITSQFEQQLRAICGLPLGSSELLRPAAMANLLGDLWEQGQPNWAAACANPNVKLHLYGKQEARPGRKMGHLTAFADSATEAAELARAARDALTKR